MTITLADDRILGLKYGKLIVVDAHAGRDRRGMRLIVCQCSCGNLTTIRWGSFQSAHIPSCGCGRNRPHGMYGTRTYKSWQSMKQRCLNPKTKYFEHYGGRGIQICPKWLSFKGFYADMGERPEGKTLDRIDVDGNYELANCRWATYKEQQHNTRWHKEAHDNYVS